MPRHQKRAQKRTRRHQRGGAALVLSPSELTDTSMDAASKQSLAQGTDFFGYHTKQHGGFIAPVGDTGVLDAGLRSSARIGGLDQALAEIQGLKDQSGGRRRKSRSTRTRRGRKSHTRRGRKSRHSRHSRRNRQYGGALGYMDVNAPGMLLAGKQAAAALNTMNAEWKLAENPGSFAPK